MSNNGYKIKKSGYSTWLSFYKLLQKTFQTNLRENPWLSHFINPKVLDVVILFYFLGGLRHSQRIPREPIPLEILKGKLFRTSRKKFQHNFHETPWVSYFWLSKLQGSIIIYIFRCASAFLMKDSKTHNIHGYSRRQSIFVGVKVRQVFESRYYRQWIFG